MTRLNVPAVVGSAAFAAVVLLSAPALAAEAATGQEPAISASLVDADKHAAKGAAIVSVTVSGVSLTDPATVNEVPKTGQAHIHYQVDNGPIIATTTPKLAFHGLAPGEHTLVVMLAANDHSPLGPKESLSVVVPSR
jgi:hypothetical protein